MEFDEFSLAAAIRAAGIADGKAAVNMATDLLTRIVAPTPEMVCEAAIERAAAQSEFDGYFADLGAES